MNRVFWKTEWSSCLIISSILQVLVNSEFTVNWSVPCASKNDKIGTYLLLNNYDDRVVLLLVQTPETIIYNNIMY